MTQAQPLRLTDDVASKERLVGDWRSLCNTFTAAGRTIREATDEFLAQHPGLTERTLYRYAARIDQADDLPQLTDAQRATIAYRRRMVDAWRAMSHSYLDAGKSKRDATAAFLAIHTDLSARTLYRWHAARDSGDPTDLLDKRKVRGKRSTATKVYGMEDVCRVAKEGPDTVSPEAWSLFKGLYLTTDARSVSLCSLIVDMEAAKHGWSWPKLRTVQQLAKKYLPPIVTYYYTHGPEAWQNKFGKKIHRDFTGYRPNQVWVGDGHTIDVFCRRSDADPTITRYTLVTWMDLRSRVIVGWSLVENENQDAILLAFRRGVEKYGPPAEVDIDNGRGYRAKGISGGRAARSNARYDEVYLRSVFGSLNVAAHFSHVRNPNGKAIMERWYRTFEEQFGSTFSGVYCGGFKDERFKAAAKKAKQHPAACPTVDEFRTAFGRYLTAYHLTPHSGSGMDGLCPDQAFVQFDPMPKVVVPEKLLDLLLMRVAAEVKVTSRGVRFLNDHYYHPNLLSLQGRTVWLKVDPDQVGYVIVVDAEGAPICKAINQKRLAGGLNLDNVKDGMKERSKARKLVASVAKGAARLAHMNVTDAAIDARLKQGEAARKLRAATGTCDAAPPRNVRPLYTDLAGKVGTFFNQVDPPIDLKQHVPRSLSEVVDDLTDDAEEDAPSRPVSLADVAFED